MPLNTEGLGIIAPDEFTLIEMWIAQGALDNGVQREGWDAPAPPGVKTFTISSGIGMMV